MKKKIAIIVVIVLLVLFSGVVVTINLLNINESDNNFDKNNMIDIKEDTNDYNNINDNDEIINILEENKNVILDEELEVEDNQEDKINNSNTSNKNNNNQNNNTSNSVKDKVDNNSNSSNVIREDESAKKEEDSKLEAKTLIRTDTLTEDSVSYKYGVKITITKTVEVKTYSDGSTEKKELNSKTTYDKSNFKATSNELLSEAVSLASKNNSIYQSVLSYVNTYRSEVGANLLTLDNDLSKAATIRALEMAYSDKFSHTRPDGTSCFSVYDDLGIFTFASGENIAYGYNNAASVSEGWRNSEGHYKNMINTNFNKIGIGMAQLDGYKYWVQLFSD